MIEIHAVRWKAMRTIRTRLPAQPIDERDGFLSTDLITCTNSRLVLLFVLRVPPNIVLPLALPTGGMASPCLRALERKLGF